MRKFRAAVATGIVALMAVTAVAGTLRINNQKTLVVIYRGEPDSEQRMSDRDLELCRNGIELGRRFYWRNSRAQFHVEFDWLIIDTTAPENGGPTYEHMEADLLERGIEPGQYDGVLTTGIGMKGNWGGFNILDGTAACFGGGGTRGGLTWYPEDDPDTGYGWGWIFAHEYQHAVDLVTANQAGREDFLHAHPYVDRAGSFFRGNYQGAEHWDWIALTLREFEGWSDLKGVRNEFIEVEDADDDGMPDADPRLPMDEARFGSDPTKVDTDGDGLDDLAEFTAGRFRGSDPRAVDTDGDGVSDGDDAYPLIAIQPTLPWDEGDRPEALLLDSVFVRNDEGGDVAVYGGWTEDSLVLRFTGPRPFAVFLNLDGSASNGFWEGGDTYLLRIEDGKVTFSGLGLKGDVPGAAAVGGETADGYELTCRIPVGIGQGVSGELNYGGEREPQDVADGLTLVNGRTVGFNVVLEFADKKRACLTPLYTMFATRLVKPADAPEKPLLRAPESTAADIPAVEVLGLRPTTPVVILAGRRVVGRGIGGGAVLLTGIDRDGEYDLQARVGDVTTEPVFVTIDRTATPPKARVGDGMLTAECEPGAEFELWWGIDGTPIAPLGGATADADGNVELPVGDDLFDGWVVTGYRGDDFARQVLVESWPAIDRNFRGGRADDRLPPDEFAYRFRGVLMVPATGPYRLELGADDGARLYIDGEMAIDHWGHHGFSTKETVVDLEAGPHPVAIDYYESDGWAGIRLRGAAADGELTEELPVRAIAADTADAELFAVQVDPLGNRSKFSKPIALSGQGGVIARIGATIR